MGAMAGLCLGATQSASRTLVAVFSPESKSAELFGFWGLFGKLASIFGLLSLGVLQVHLGLQSAILLCSLFFLAALLLALLVREPRGRAAAAAYIANQDRRRLVPKSAG
jgi:UMF1 family MFS transporter